MKFVGWGQQYGPIYQVNLAGTTHIMISTESITKELFVNRASIYSDRPQVPSIVHDSRNSAQYLPLLGHNGELSKHHVIFEIEYVTLDAWRRGRKFTKAFLVEDASRGFYKHPEEGTRWVLRQLLKNPNEYVKLFQLYVARTASALAWSQPEAGPDLLKTTRALLFSVSPGGEISNVLTPLMKLPTFMAPWKRRDLDNHEWRRKLFLGKQKDVRQDLKNDSGMLRTWTSAFLQKKMAADIPKDVEGAYLVGMGAITSALTISVALQNFLLAMVLNPEWQQKIQLEMEEQIGDRLPTQADSSKLLTLRACIRETFRW